jgi:hypothetical protein
MQGEPLGKNDNYYRKEILTLSTAVSGRLGGQKKLRQRQPERSRDASPMRG